MLIINTDDLTKDNSSIFGIIYLKIDDLIYPDTKWNDFVVVVAHWWCKGIYGLIENRSLSSEIDFMDGPYKVRIDFVEEGKFSLYFF